MVMRLYNYISRKTEGFRPLRGKTVGLYTCGPTVYDTAHIGNLRTYVFEDVLRRTLEMAGFRVKHVMNITDVDDKTIARAKERGITQGELTRGYEKAFFADLEKLNIKPAWKYPRATEHVREMIAQIKALMKKGLAYEADGSVYFDISKFKNYGRLSRIEKRQLKAGASASARRDGRVDVDEYAKDAAEDFALWKAKKGGEPSWPSPWGEGRPGWHIECSAMSKKYLGQPFDIHTGGTDHLFPHHENEIAQSEGAYAKPLARFFVEGEHMLIEGKKMSKSLGNVITLSDVEKRGRSALAFRYFVLSSHYRSLLNFTWEALESAERSLERVRERAVMLAQLPKTNNSAAFRREFLRHIEDDLDMPQALATFWKYFDNESLADLLWADKILGLGLASSAGVAIPASIKKLARERETARNNKDWKRADEIREELRQAGWLVDDTPQGPALKPEKK